jgi:hypothetical protein
MRTLRGRIIDLLLEHEDGLRVGEMIQLLNLDPRMERDVLNALSTIPGILKRKGLKMFMIPPKCSSCGFEFRRPKASRCPRCKGQRIEEAVFVLRT